jgi:hypothetical protein
VDENENKNKNYNRTRARGRGGSFIHIVRIEDTGSSILTVLHWRPVLTVQSLRSCSGSPVLEVLSWRSCPGRPVWHASSACPGSLVLHAIFNLSQSAVPILAVLVLVFLALLSLLSCPGCPVPANLSWLFCTGRPALSVFCLFSSTVLTMLCWQSFSACPVLLALFRFFPF